MKRLLSLLVVLAMVVSMIPNVFAAKDSIDMDELLGKLTILDSIDEINVALAAGAGSKTYKWTPDKAGILTITLAAATEGTSVAFSVAQGENKADAAEGVATLEVVAGEEVSISVSEANGAAVEATLIGELSVFNNTPAEAITVTFTWNAEHTEGTATVTAEPGTTYFTAFGVAGMELTINGGEPVVLVGNPRNPPVFTIVNNGDAAAEYALKVTLPLGSQMNPEVLEELNWYFGDVALAANDNDGYYYTYTAPADGSVLLYISSIPEGVTGDIVVTNMNTSAQKTLLQDGVDNYGLELTVDVSEGDELSIQLVVVPDANFNIPAAEISWTGNFTYPEGSEQNPVQIEWQWNEEYTEATATVTVPAGKTLYYAGVNGMLLSINGGEPVLMQGVGFGPMASPYVFTLTAEAADAQFELKITYPVGSMENPAELVIGENTATIEAGTQGCFYGWTAEANGKLTITMPEGNWFYVIQNMTTSVSSDMQSSDADPVVPSTTVDVKAGDEIIVQVNTYDPENPWNAPAGSITFTAAFEEVELPAYIPGDVDGDNSVDEDDAIFVLQYILLGGEMFPVNQPVDFDGNGTANEDDAIYLLQYVLLGEEMFPLH